MLLEVRNLSKVYKKGSRQVKANDNITFSVDQGDVLGILGPNRAGKTTLIKQIATLLIPDQGDILYQGVSLVRRPEIIRGRFSFLWEGTQNVYHYLTGEANILYFAYLNQVPSSLEGKTEDLKNLSKEEEYILYLRNSAKAREKLRKYDLQFEILSDVTLKTTLRLGQKELFYSVFSDPDFEVLNLEKKSPDFEAIFRRLYGEYSEGNQS
ncbi:MAG TPA: ATP-binding cassette domain-containing protein [Clostridia bacterium]|nr:ATP-binding cassette domain-containing protein [Clostridia bacterium]